MLFFQYGSEIDMHQFDSVNFVGNYWQANSDLYEKTGPREFQKYYEILARTMLGATPEPTTP